MADTVEKITKCYTCNENKNKEDFYASKPTKCKKCISDRGKVYRVENKDEIKERGVQYRKNNRDKINKKLSEYQKNNPHLRRDYYAKNKERLQGFTKASYLKKREENIQKRKIYYQNNKEKHAENRAKYEANNKDRLRAARRKWENNRLATDINYKLHKNISGRIREELNGKKKRTDRTEMLLGCTIEELKIFIQNQFQDGMTWGNWELNGWHIDHRIPLSWFNLENENCRKLAFGYKNLQPLWGADNLRKKNFYSDKLAS